MKGPGTCVATEEVASTSSRRGTAALGTAVVILTPICAEGVTSGGGALDKPRLELRLGPSECKDLEGRKVVELATQGLRYGGGET